MTEEYIPRFPKPGIKRLYGEDLRLLRLACYLKYDGRCVKCGEATMLDAPEWHPLKADMAHIKTKRNNGDTIDNVELWCHRDHMRYHNGTKPCPPKNGEIQCQSHLPKQ